MGEIADMMLSGLLDCETGEFIDGEEPGYPRTLERSVSRPRAGNPASQKKTAKRHAQRKRARDRKNKES